MMKGETFQTTISLTERVAHTDQAYRTGAYPATEVQGPGLSVQWYLVTPCAMPATTK